MKQEGEKSEHNKSALWKKVRRSLESHWIVLVGTRNTSMVLLWNRVMGAMHEWLIEWPNERTNGRTDEGNSELHIAEPSHFNRLHLHFMHASNMQIRKPHKVSQKVNRTATTGLSCCDIH